MKKLALGLAPLVVLAFVSVWSTCRVVGAGASVPDDRAWAKAAAVVRAEYQPGDLIRFAPRWIDPVGRMHLGDLIPIEMAARMDDERYPRVWVLSIRGASIPTYQRPDWRKQVDGIAISRFDRPRPTLVSDLVQIAAEAPGSLQTTGLFSRGPQVVLAEVGFEPHRCVQIVPSPGQEVSVTFPAVKLGGRLAGAVGLADVFTRRDERAPIELIVQLDGTEIARAKAGVNSGWVHWEGTTQARTGKVTFIARAVGGAKARDRLVCFAAEARDP